MIVLIAVILLVVFWREVNSALRGIFPSWPFVLALPILFYAYYRHGPIDREGSSSLGAVKDYLVGLLRTNVELPLGQQTFRLYLFCHGIPDRCFTIRGHTFPICARCTGLLIGVVAGLLLPTAQYFASVAAIGLSLLLVAPLLVDGLTQLAGLRQSTNPLRLVTGLACGFALAVAAQALLLTFVGV